MNEVILMGRLVRDPDYKILERNGEPLPVARYTLAVPRIHTKDQADFVNCVVFRRGAEVAHQYYHKGIRILVSGRIQTGNYQNKEGQTVYTTEVIVEHQEYADGKLSVPATPTAPEPSPAPKTADGFMDIPDGVEDEGLPFND